MVGSRRGGGKEILTGQDQMARKENQFYFQACLLAFLLAAKEYVRQFGAPSAEEHTRPSRDLENQDNSGDTKAH